MLGIAVTFIVCLVVRVSAAIRQACLRVSWSCFRDPPTHTLGLGNKFQFIPNNNGRSQGEAWNFAVLPLHVVVLYCSLPLL